MSTYPARIDNVKDVTVYYASQTTLLTAEGLYKCEFKGLLSSSHCEMKEKGTGLLRDFGQREGLFWSIEGNDFVIRSILNYSTLNRVTLKNLTCDWRMPGAIISTTSYYMYACTSGGYLETHLF